MQDEMNEPPEFVSPVNPLPPVVLLLAALVFGVEAVLSLGEAGVVGGPTAIGWRSETIAAYAYVPGVSDYVFAGRFDWEIVRRFFSYLFVHHSFTDALFSAVLLLALGKFVGEVLHSVALAAVFLVSGLVGALAFGAAMTDNYPLVGAWSGVYGLIGAFTYITWQRLGQRGQSQLAAFRMIAFLLALQLVFAVIFSSDGSFLLRLTLALPEVAGFVCGLALTPFVAPGGAQAALRRLRQG